MLELLGEVLEHCSTATYRSAFLIQLRETTLKTGKRNEVAILQLHNGDSLLLPQVDDQIEALTKTHVADAEPLQNTWMAVHFSLALAIAHCQFELPVSVLRRNQAGDNADQSIRKCLRRAEGDIQLHILRSGVGCGHYVVF